MSFDTSLKFYNYAQNKENHLIHGSTVCAALQQTPVVTRVSRKPQEVT